MAEPHQRTERPNILLLFADQLRADTLGYAGHPWVRTPRIDGLAAAGTVFDRAYTSSPVCVAARCSLITGQEPQHTGCFDNGFAMPRERPTLMSCLADAGYQTHGVGKMHFTPDRAAMMGFESRETSEETGPVEGDDYLRFLHDHGYGHVERPHGLRSEMYYIPQLSVLPEHLHFSRWAADRSIDFLRQRPKDRPFFLWTSFIHPHPPFSPPAPWHRLYPPMRIGDPHRPWGESSLLTLHNVQQNRYKFRDGGDDRRLLQVIRAYYLATISFLDLQVGRILAALDALGERENTLVVFTSDHGEFLGDYGCFGKRSFLDVAARVPLICSGPGFDSGRSDVPVSLLDLMPTFLDAAGVALRDLALDGLPLDDVDGREALYGQFQTGPLGLYYVVTRDWKYAYSAADAREYLLDCRHDPAETRNVAYNTYLRAPLRAMRQLASNHFLELAGLDVDATTYNTPTRLGGQPDTERFRALAIDDDAGGLVLPHPHGTPRGEAYEEYWTEDERYDAKG